MIQEIIPKIKDKKIILFGEIHGTKEIPEMLSQFFSEVAKEEDFNVCLEIPIEFQENIEDFFKVSEENIKNSDGRNSLEYLNLIKNLYDINLRDNKDIKIFCIDPIAKNQEEKEKGLADNILKSIKNKKTFVILGSIHASKNIILFPEIKIVPTGNILFEKLNGKMFNVNILPLKGKFYNFGIKEIFNNYDDSFNKGFDYVLQLKSITPCSFLF